MFIDVNQYSNIPAAPLRQPSPGVHSIIAAIINT